jgi:DNA-binding transcriptional LysR family regulator
MDLRRLSYFVLACQEQGFAATAAQLNITQSTLSGALKTLSEEIGVPLFEQVQRRVHPTPAGIWLYRSALLLLHAEEFSRRWIAHGPDDQSSAHLIVDVKASFALGRLAKTVSRAIQIYGRLHPNIFIQPCFSGVDQTPGQARSIAGDIGKDRRSLLVIDARPCDATSGIDDPDRVTVLADDPWVVMRAVRTPERPGLAVRGQRLHRARPGSGPGRTSERRHRRPGQGRHRAIRRAGGRPPAADLATARRRFPDPQIPGGRPSWP